MKKPKQKIVVKPTKAGRVRAAEDDFEGAAPVKVPKTSRNAASKKSTKKPTAKRKPEARAIATSHSFTVDLQNRHAQWVVDTAEILNDTPERIIEQAVRQAYARDHYKAGRSGGVTLLAGDNKYAGRAGQSDD